MQEKQNKIPIENFQKLVQTGDVTVHVCLNSGPSLHVCIFFRYKDVAR